MQTHGCGNYEENDAVTEETLFFEDVSAWFNFEFNKLSYIELGVFVTDDGTGELWTFTE